MQICLFFAVREKFCLKADLEDFQFSTDDGCEIDDDREWLFCIQSGATLMVVEGCDVSINIQLQCLTGLKDYINIKLNGCAALQFALPVCYIRTYM